MTLGPLEIERLGDWGTAITIAVAVFLTLWVLRWVARFIAHRLGASTEPTSLRMLPERLLARTFLLFTLAVAIYAGSLPLNLVDEAQLALRALAVLVVVIQVGVWGNETIRFSAARYQAQAGSDPAVIATVYGLSFVAMLVMWFVLLLVGLDNIGVEITALVAGLGIGGIAIALAAQSVLGDLLASLAIIIDRPFVVGDFITTGDMMGTVEHIGIKTTRVRSLSGEQLVFPNSDLVSSRIRNYRLMRERRIEFRFGLFYSTPPDLVERAPAMVREIIEEQMGVRFDRAHFKQIGESSLVIEAVYFVLSPEYNVYMDIHQAINLAIFRRLQDAGMSFALPPWTVATEPAQRPHRGAGLDDDSAPATR
jgi:small-conductance mechanosensitive channel